jgi:hypothetical protein
MQDAAAACLAVILVFFDGTESDRCSGIPPTSAPQGIISGLVLAGF